MPPSVLLRHMSKRYLGEYGRAALRTTDRRQGAANFTSED